jgi:Sporulation and spore germination
MTPRQVDLSTAVGLVALLAAVSLTAPRWSGLLREPLAVFGDAEGAAPAPSPSPEGGAEVARRISVRLYFAAPETPGLLPEERTIPFSSALAPQVRTLVEELVKGPTSALLPTLPPETRVLEVFVTGPGVAYVDLSGEATSLAGGSREELLTVYSIVDSLVANFPAVGRVQILVEDRIVPSLNGHVDLSRPLPADMTLVALPPLPPAPAEAAP